MLSETITEKLRKDFPDSQFEITDLTGSGDHYRVHIRSSHFRGLSLIKQHQRVYAALSELLSGPLHALQLETEDLPEISGDK